MRESGRGGGAREVYTGGRCPGRWARKGGERVIPGQAMSRGAG